MNQFKEIIKAAQQMLSCPVCKKKFNLNEIKIRGWFDNTYFLAANCANKHKRVNISIVINIKSKNTNTSKINKDNWQKITQTIDQFDGDFEKLWKK